jgi:hypothetical protein
MSKRAVLVLVVWTFFILLITILRDVKMVPVGKEVKLQANSNELANSTELLPANSNELLPAKRHFVSGKFGFNNKFVREVEKFREHVKKSGIFPEENIFVYSQFPDFILSDKRFVEHLRFLNDPKANPRGGGYWFWKSQLIAHHLARIPMGDFLVYLDLDVPDEFVDMELLMETMVFRHANFASYDIKHKNRQWMKRDIYEAYCPGVNITEDETFQFAANILYFRKSPGTIRFVDDWAKGVADYHMINDEPSRSGPEIPSFRENRHDQSILSIISKCKYQYPGKTPFRFRGGNWILHTYTIPDKE